MLNSRLELYYCCALFITILRIYYMKVSVELPAHRRFLNIFDQPLPRMFSSIFATTKNSVSSSTNQVYLMSCYFLYLVQMVAAQDIWLRWCWSNQNIACLVYSKGIILHRNLTLISPK